MSTCPCSTCGAALDTTGTCPDCGAAPSFLALAVQPRGAVRAPVHVAVAADLTPTGLLYREGAARLVSGLGDRLLREDIPAVFTLYAYGDDEAGAQAELLLESGTADNAAAALRSADEKPGSRLLREPHLLAWETVRDLLQTFTRAGERPVLLGIFTDDSRTHPAGLSPRELGETFRRIDALVYLAGALTPSIWEFIEAAGGGFFPLSNDPTPGEMDDVARRIGQAISQRPAQAGRTQPLVAAGPTV